MNRSNEPFLYGEAYKITCEKCGFVDYPFGPPPESNFRSATLVEKLYVDVSTLLFPLYEKKIWCCDCRKTSFFEVIPTEDEIVEEINKFQAYIDAGKANDDETNIYQLTAPIYSEFIKHKSEWLSWANHRELGRCLSCGGTQSIDLNFDEVGALEFSHPGCGGNLTLSIEKAERFLSYQLKRINTFEQILIPYSTEGFPLISPQKQSTELSDLDEKLKEWLSKRKEVLDRCEALRKNGGLGANPDPAKVDPEYLEEPLRSLAKKALNSESHQPTEVKGGVNSKSEHPQKCAEILSNFDQEWPDISPFFSHVMKRIYETRGALNGLESDKEYIEFKDDFNDLAERITRVCLIEAYSPNAQRENYLEPDLQEFYEDFPEFSLALLEAARCYTKQNLEADIRSNAHVSGEMSLQYDWISQPTLVTSNPFYLLGATPEDDSGRIVELADERSLEIDPSKCTKARTDLVNPRNRLAAEIRYMPGCSGKTIQDLWRDLHAGQKSLLQIPGLPALTKANLLASAIQLLPPETPPRLRGEWIIDLAYTAASINVDEVIDDINHDRIVAGFPQVQSSTDIENILNELIREYRDAVKSALNVLPPNELVDTVTYAVSVSSKEGETSCPLLIDELVDGYESEARPTLQKGAESILHLIESIQEDADQGLSAIQPSINKLMSSVRSWDRLAQPIQVSHKSRGLDHDLSHQIAWNIRNLAIDLFNNHGMLEVADDLTDLSKEIFAELPDVVGKLEEDSEALEEIYQKRLKEKDDQQAWEKDITYKAELGLVFKDILAISPKGVQWKSTVYPLENVNRIRWGATQHYTNGIPTGTTYLIAFGNQNGMSVVETRDMMVYNTFIDKLWKAVGVRLVTQLIEGLEAGKQYSWDGVTLDKHGVKIVIKRLLQSDLEGYRQWKDVVMDHANGCLVVSFRDDKKLHRELSYQNLNNIHVLETAMNFIIKQRR